MPASRLSVIMPMYNAARFVEAAIDSVLAQSMGDFIFYIVDDGSTDESGEIAARKAVLDPRIHLIRQENQGIVISLNRMLALVDSDLVARMDADDIALPDRFLRQLDRMYSDPTLGALGTQFIEIGEQGEILQAGFRQPVGRDAVRAALQERQPIANPSAMFRTQALRDAGLYRPAFRYCEDYDLFLRLSESADIDNLPDILFHYRRSPGQMSIANNVRQTRQSVYARLAHRERLAGRADPFADLDDLPPVSALDALIGRAGVARAVEADIMAALRYSVADMDDEEFAGFCRNVASGVPLVGAFRSVLRCLVNRSPGRAARLAVAIARGGFAPPRVAKTR